MTENFFMRFVVICDKLSMFIATLEGEEAGTWLGSGSSSPLCASCYQFLLSALRHIVNFFRL